MIETKITFNDGIPVGFEEALVSIFRKHCAKAHVVIEQDVTIMGILFNDAILDILFAGSKTNQIIQRAIRKTCDRFNVHWEETWD